MCVPAFVKKNSKKEASGRKVIWSKTKELAKNFD